MVRKPQLIQCFQFGNDDWNMVSRQDYDGQYQEQAANTWFTLFRYGTSRVTFSIETFSRFLSAKYSMSSKTV